jgi:hypothetical protein
MRKRDWMPIITRSKDKKLRHEQENKEEKVETETHRKPSKKKPFLIFKLANPKKEAHQEDSSDEEEEFSSDEEEEYSDEEFEVPPHIEKNKALFKKTQKILEYIQKKTVRLEDIVEAPMRLKHKAEMFELHYIFENSVLNSEERMDLRKTLHRTFQDYLHEYQQFLQNKDQIKHYEKCEKKSSSVLDLQYDILRLETSQENKEVIFYKFMELKEKTYGPRR